MEQAIEKIKEGVIPFLENIGMEYTSVEVTDEGGKIWINVVPSEKASLYIGYRGANLTALQHLVKSVLWTNGIDKNLFIIFDIDGYKRKNNEKILRIANEKSQMVYETGVPQLMPFLSPSDRRVVHMEIANNFPSLTTESFTDEEGNRVLKIIKS